MPVPIQNTERFRVPTQYLELMFRNRRPPACPLCASDVAVRERSRISYDSQCEASYEVRCSNSRCEFRINADCVLVNYGPPQYRMIEFERNYEPGGDGIIMPIAQWPEPEIETEAQRSQPAMTGTRVGPQTTPPGDNRAGRDINM